MNKLIQSISPSDIIYSFLFIIVAGIVVIYWDRKRLKERRKQELEEKKKELDFLLESEEIPEDYYLKY